MTDLGGNSQNWKIGPKDLVAHRKAKEVRCQEVCKLRYVVWRASATMTGKVWKQRGRFWFGIKQMTLHDQYGSRTDTAGFHQHCIFPGMTRSCLQTQQTQKGKQNPHDIQPVWQKNGTCTLAVGHRSTDSSLVVWENFWMITPYSAWITLNHEPLLIFLVALALPSWLNSLLLS